jgi:hypothetical protein
MKSKITRMTVDLTDDQRSELAALQKALNSPTSSNTIRSAVKVCAQLAEAIGRGDEVLLRSPTGELTQVLLLLGANRPSKDCP